MSQDLRGPPRLGLTHGSFLLARLSPVTNCRLNIPLTAGRRICSQPRCRPLLSLLPPLSSFGTPRFASPPLARHIQALRASVSSFFHIRAALLENSHYGPRLPHWLLFRGKRKGSARADKHGLARGDRSHARDHSRAVDFPQSDPDGCGAAAAMVPPPSVTVAILEPHCIMGYCQEITVTPTSIY